MLTCNQKKQALDHILNVIWQEDGSDTTRPTAEFLAYVRWKDIRDISNLTYEMIDKL